MENRQEQEKFSYTYSAKQQEEIKNIRKKYTVPEENKMEQLRRLDSGVMKKAACISLIVGIVGVLIFGMGMSIIMSDIGETINFSKGASMTAGILIGIIGILILSIAYPLYKLTLKKEREKIAPEIIRLTDELMK